MIVTFYSYKGGVGRSMALANIADQLARSGMRVLMVDFDLEAPGLEHFFPAADRARVRGKQGLLDLLLAFKYAMSVASSDASEEGEDAYRNLDRYISTIYPRRSDGGCLDLLPAGLRRTDEQIARYGAELRRFDWQNFYYVWSGELFFEWFRKTCAERYDVVLVDSRTGVTELGGVCAYQLADVIVALCAANLQNVEGTEWMVRHFLSPQVRAVRGDRPLEALVVPARIDQQDAGLLAAFADRFRQSFDQFTPTALAEAGTSFWELQVPYTPSYAFDEQVITDPGRAEERRALVRAYESLRGAIALLAPEGNRLSSLRPGLYSGAVRGPVEPVETRYDPTSRFASADVLLSYRSNDRAAADQIRELLASRNVRVVEAESGRLYDETPRAKSNLFLVGRPGLLSPWQRHELAILAARDDAHFLPVLLPGVSRPPEELRRFQFLDFRDGLEQDWLLDAVEASLARQTSARPEPGRGDRCPYPGLDAFSEADAEYFFGREELIDEVLRSLEAHGTCAITGGAASGKTSVVNAGVLPALRAGRLPGSEFWPVVRVNHDSGTEELSQALRSAGDGRVVVVLDQFEELDTMAGTVQLLEAIDSLRQLYMDVASRLLPITVVRSDFLDLVQTSAPFLTQHVVAVPPMTEDELRQTVEMPARFAGLQLEPGLADLLVRDVHNQLGALPLLQATLSRVWQLRHDGYLTHQAYAESGGVLHSLAGTAEELFSSLSPEEKEQARDLLLDLVTVHASASGQYTSRTVPTATMSAGKSKVCERMVGQRLLIVTTDAQNEPCVQLAHEALVNTWPRFRSWIDDASSALLLRQHLSFAAEDWNRSGRQRTGLLGEEAMSLVNEVERNMRLDLGTLEEAYLSASRANAERADRARWLSIIFAVAAAAVLVLSMVVWTGSTLVASAAGAVSGLAAGFTALAFRRRERRSLSPWS